MRMLPMLLYDGEKPQVQYIVLGMYMCEAVDSSNGL